MNQSTELFIALQRLLPKHTLSRLVARLAESTHPRIKNFLIKQAIKVFDINMQEAISDDLAHYESFNAFFTRELKPDARPIDLAATAVVSPADGMISQAGKIEKNRILQAKGVDYSINRLIGDSKQATIYKNGTFATICLLYTSPSPRDGLLSRMPSSA